MESGGKDVHPVAGHDMNGSRNEDTWTVYKQIRGETNMAWALTNTLYHNDRVTEYNLQKFSA